MPDVSPFETIQQLAGGYVLARSLHVVTDLGVADVLGDEPRTAADLAAHVHVQPDALGRVLRLLAAHGVFEAATGGFRHSPASRLLRSDHPQSMRDFVRMFGLDVNWRAYEALAHSVRTGQPATQKVLSTTFWEYFASHPTESAIFNAAMTAKAQAQIPAIIAAYDFSRFRTVADVGGGRGHLLKAIVERHRARGVLFDQPHVVGDVHDMPPGVTLQGGDFFSDALPSCDAYVLMEIIHDWNDQDAVRILKNVRRAAGRDARLLLIETTVPDSSAPDWSQMLDIHMLTFVGGKQRTIGEYRTLVGDAGFELVGDVDTGAGISVVEAVPV